MEYIRSEVNSIGALNAELEKIETALADKLSTESTGPRTMNADLDMNSNQILNLGTPTAPTDPIRKQDIDAYFMEMVGADITLRSDLAVANSTVGIAGVSASYLAKSVTKVSPKAWGILCNGTDETSKWQALINYCATNRLAIGAFTGSTLITSQLVFPTGFGGIYGEAQLYMVFRKGFNGHLFSLNAQSMVLEHFWIQGDGANFTGGGLYVISDNIELNHLRVEDTVDSPVICKNSQAVFLKVDNCHLVARDVINTPSIRNDGVDASTSPTVRQFNHITGAFYPVDCEGMNDFSLSNSLFSKLGFGSNCSKGKFYANRITAAANSIEVLGNSHTFTSNIVNMGASNDFILSGSNNSFDDSNVYSKGTDSKASIVVTSTYGGPLTHSVASKATDVSSQLVLKGSTTDWTKGNATVSAYYRLSDQACYYTFNITFGSTTVTPTGAFLVTLPFKALVGSQGSVKIRSNAGVSYTGTLQLFGGNNYALLWINATSNPVSETSITWGNTAAIDGTIEYLVAAA